MIEIKSNITIPKINDLYTELERKKKSAIKLDLKLPKKIDNLDFGVLFSFLQFIATWIRSDISGNLILPIDNVKDIKEYLINDFVYPSVGLFWEKEIVDLSGNNIRPYLKEYIQEYFRKMEFFALDKNPQTVPIFCFDNDKRKSGYPKCLYDTNQRLYTEDALGFNLYPAYQKLGSLNPGVFAKSISKRLDAFNAIIHELFVNTDEHAKTNEVGHRLYPNIRAIYLKFHRRTIESYCNTYKDFPGLLEYFQSGFDLNKQGELYLIEISILDSGPGLIKRYKGVSSYDFSINEEVDLIKACLYKNNTSAQGMRGEVKGLGLDRVMQAIDGKGFVRIKTGRADVFRNMKKWRYKHHKSLSSIDIFDWQTDDSDSFITNAESVGTLISIFFPLDYTVK